MLFAKLVLPLTALLMRGVTAHGGVWNYSIAGEWRPGFFPYYPAEGQSSIQRHWDDFAPIKNVTSNDIVCNKPATIAEEYATIAAGSEIGASWRFWPHDKGPVLVWMARCGDNPTDCDTFDGIGNHWFKINETGLLEGGTIGAGPWAQNILNAANYTWNATIPATLKQGAYLVRHEIIALHVPYEPEWYPECAHLYVTGPGNALPSSEYLASLPGVYSLDSENPHPEIPFHRPDPPILSCSVAKAQLDPELNLTIYEDPTMSRTSWTIPGPPVWRGD